MERPPLRDGGDHAMRIVYDLISFPALSWRSDSFFGELPFLGFDGVFVPNAYLVLVRFCYLGLILFCPACWDGDLSLGFAWVGWLGCRSQ